MRALVLAGGFGTRMRPLTDSVPKSLLPICNRPFLEHQIRLLAAHGIETATLLTGYLAEDFDWFVEEVAALGVRLEISTEHKPLGTAGAARSVLDRLDGTTVVFNGDVLTDLDVAAMLELHRTRNAALTIALTPVQDARPYGLVPTDPHGRVEAFLEKPADPVAGMINAGTYVLEPRVLEEVPPDETWSFETQLFPSLLERGDGVYGFESDAYWLDMGTPDRYRQAHRDVLEGRAKAEIRGRRVDDTVRMGQGIVAGPSIVDEPALIGPGAVVGPLSSIGANVLIGGRARVERSIVHDDVRIGVGAVVRDCILGRGARVPVGATIEGEVLA